MRRGQSLKGFAAEYEVSKASISNWTKQFREKCQTNEEAQADYDFMKENLKLKRQLAELQKEKDFLKKRWHITGTVRKKLMDYLAENGISVYRFAKDSGIHKVRYGALSKRRLRSVGE